MNWTHPTERSDASAELRLLGKAWMAILQSLNPQENEDSAPAWAREVFSAFAAENPGFDDAECMTPAWVEEKRAAYYEAVKRSAAEKTNAVKALVIAGDLQALIAAGVKKSDVRFACEIGSPEWKAQQHAVCCLVWGRNDQAIGVKK